MNCLPLSKIRITGKLNLESKKSAMVFKIKTNESAFYYMHIMEFHIKF